MSGESKRGELRPGELRVVLLAGAFFFCLLASYYALRPLRDAYGAEDSTRLQWLFTGTLLGTLAAQPLFGRLVSRQGRAKFLPRAYRFLAVNAIAFGLLLDGLDGTALVWMRRLFFVWLSVFNMFVLSLFWGFLADIMGSARAKRLYGRIAIGGTLGALAGASLAGLWMEELGMLASAVGLASVARPAFLLPLFSALLLEGAVRAARALERARLAKEPDDPHSDARTPVGGRTLDGFRAVLRSHHLAALCLYVTLFVLGSTVLYEITSVLTKAAFESDARTQFNARIDLWVNVVALTFQLFLTGRILPFLGLGISLAAVPMVGMAGFAAVASSSGLMAIATLSVLRRGFEYGLSKPAREALFTVLTRDEKYKAKSVIDTVVYRGGDAAAMWLQAGLGALGVGISALAWGMVPMCALGVVVAFALGREHARRASALAARGEAERAASGREAATAAEGVAPRG